MNLERFEMRQEAKKVLGIIAHPDDEVLVIPSEWLC
jgi:LmbE family N-acetylglucosaminyl deacetylase